MQNLTTGEFEILIEAVDVWPSRHAAGEILGSVVEAMVSSKNEDMGETLEERREKKNAEREETNKQESEIATVLKAKLIQMRDASHVTEIAEELNK